MRLCWPQQALTLIQTTNPGKRRWRWGFLKVRTHPGNGSTTCPNKQPRDFPSETTLKREGTRACPATGLQKFEAWVLGALATSLPRLATDTTSLRRHIQFIVHRILWDTASSSRSSTVVVTARRVTTQTSSNPVCSLRHCNFILSS